MSQSFLPFADPPAALPPVQAVFPAASSRRRTLPLLAILVLLAAGWGAYARVTGFDFITLDDPAYVYENQAIQYGLTPKGVHWAFTSLSEANWHPLTWLSLMADYQLYGMNPGGYHLTNLLLHETATVLLFLWLLLATRRPWRAAGAALLFCIHPAHVESVAWVTERKDVLSAVFFFAALLAYTRYAQTKKRGFYAAALVALAAGLLAKPMLVTVPPLLLILDAWPLGRVRRPRDLIALGMEKLPFASLAAAASVVTFIAQHQGRATVALEVLPIRIRAASALMACAAYLGKLFWPVDLAVFYPYWTSQPVWRTASCGLLLGGMTLAAARLWRSRPYVLVGWLWFLGMLVPVIGLVQVGGQAMADRYTYLPSVGLFIALCWAAAGLWDAAPRLRPALAVGAAASVAACLALCWRQVGYWENSVTLMEHTVAVTPPASNTLILLGDSYSRMNRYAEAEKVYRRAFKNEPVNADLVMKLGYLQLEQGHWELSRRWLAQVAARKNCPDPVFYNNYGFVLNRLGRTDEAAEAFRRSLALRPDYAYAHCNLAEALNAAGQLEAAAPEYERALALKPDLPAALTQLAWLYSFADPRRTQERGERALELARRAVDLSRGGDVDSLDALAAAQAAVRNWPEAAVAARAAWQAAAANPDAPADFIALRRERLDNYLAGHWPPR